ncbi:MAG: PcfJ domain-containing protein [Clostridia bacterium]|nr:PcfJ domain-containing protein [Clostridia bacterium]
MSETNYADMLPIKPPQGIFDMAERHWKDTNALVMNVDWLRDPITELKNRAVHCHCTACNESFYCDYTPGGTCCFSRSPYGFFNYRTNEHVTSYNNTLCPECGAPVKAIAISDMYSDGHQLGCKTFVAVQKIENKLCIISWWLQKSVNKKGEISIESRPREAYIAEGKKLIRVAGCQRYFYSYSYYNKWEPRKRYDDTLCEVDENFILPFGEEVLIGTACENSKLDIFAKGSDRMIVSYLRLWQKHPNIENLVMQGHSDLVNEALTTAKDCTKGYNYRNWRGSTNTDAFDFKKARPHEMLRLSKEQYRAVVKNNLSLALIQDLELYHKYDCRVTADNIEKISKNFKYRYSEFTETGESLITAFNYLERQEKKYPGLKSRIEVETLLDYWALCQERDIDYDDPKNRYPQNLVAKHDQLVSLIKFEKSQELIKKFKARSKQLAPFAFADEETGLMITACPDEEQLINEGEKLDHCVATYADSHAEGKTAIFFIRHIDAPGTPFFTLELDEKTYRVRQNRGSHNCARTPEVKAFEEKWLAYLKTNNIGKEVKKNGKRNRKSELTAAVA